MRKYLALVALVALTWTFAGTGKAAPLPAGKGADIDVVLCLDVSGSMNGLVNSARAKLWDIVNDLGKVEPTPNLRVALYSYGHQTYPADKGWVRQEIGLTEDLDTVYQKLNALKLNGGNEYVARVTHTALNDLKWSKGKDALRLIFVAGNEPASQDKSISLEQVGKLAIEKNVIINTIYCVSPRFKEDPDWRKLARLAEGEHVSIDQNKIVNINTPFDEEITKLSAKLNTTYLACGAEAFRDEKRKNQREQDANAAKQGQQAAASRGLSKANALYRNSSWDLVDRYKLDPEKFDITKIPVEHLPKDMQKMKPEERVAHIKKMLEDRKAIQKQINELSAKRNEHVQKELKKLNSEGDQRFDEALRSTLKKQAESKGIRIPKK